MTRVRQHRGCMDFRPLEGMEPCRTCGAVPEPVPTVVREPNGTEHLVYTDEFGRPDECHEECPGCHWEGNADCEALSSGCDMCDPDGVLYAELKRQWDEA